MIPESIKTIKTKLENVVVVDGVETESGDILFTLDNQPILVNGKEIIGLNWSYQPHRSILEKAIKEISNG